MKSVPNCQTIQEETLQEDIKKALQKEDITGNYPYRKMTSQKTTLQKDRKKALLRVVSYRCTLGRRDSGNIKIRRKLAFSKSKNIETQAKIFMFIL